MRILLGITILWDLCIITSSLFGLLGDTSVLPPSIALSSYFEQNYRTIHVLSGAPRWQVFLMSIHFLTTIAFLLGRKTKYTTPLLWFLTCSLQGANPLIANGGDSVVRLLLFWAMFLPIAKVWSIDQQEKVQDFKVSSIATA